MLPKMLLKTFSNKTEGRKIKVISNKTEFFTAKEAVKLELYDAIKRGETKFEGHYELSREGDFGFNQKNFVFKDKRGNLRVGKFTDVDEVLKFMEYIREREEKENA